MNCYRCARVFPLYNIIFLIVYYELRMRFQRTLIAQQYSSITFSLSSRNLFSLEWSNQHFFSSVIFRFWRIGYRKNDTRHFQLLLIIFLFLLYYYLLIIIHLLLWILFHCAWQFFRSSSHQCTQLISEFRRDGGECFPPAVLAATK